MFKIIIFDKNPDALEMLRSSIQSRIPGTLILATPHIDEALRILKNELGIGAVISDFSIKSSHGAPRAPEGEIILGKARDAGKKLRFFIITEKKTEVLEKLGADAVFEKGDLDALIAELEALKDR